MRSSRLLCRAAGHTDAQCDLLIALAEPLRGSPKDFPEAVAECELLAKVTRDTGRRDDTRHFRGKAIQTWSPSKRGRATTAIEKARRNIGCTEAACCNRSRLIYLRALTGGELSTEHTGQRSFARTTTGDRNYFGSGSYPRTDLNPDSVASAFTSRLIQASVYR